jgi:hypothetical protein
LLFFMKTLLDRRHSPPMPTLRRLLDIRQRSTKTPATHAVPSEEYARAWIRFEADQFGGADIIWIDGPP